MKIFCVIKKCFDVLKKRGKMKKFALLVFAAFALISCGEEWSEAAKDSMTWEEAKKYCENLGENGHTDWHLPTIDELRALIVNCETTEPMGNCLVSEKEETCRQSGTEEPECFTAPNCYAPNNTKHEELNHLTWDDLNPAPIKLAQDENSNSLEYCKNCLVFDAEKENCRECADCKGCQDGKNHSSFGDSGWFWSSSARSDDAIVAFRVNFDTGEVGNYNKDHKYKVRCIRK